MEEYEKNDSTESEYNRKQKFRIYISYWLLGLCNNYGYVVMLTAAADIIRDQDVQKKTNITNTKERDCNVFSTGTILLADIMPCLIIKLLGPFMPFFIHVRIAICVFLSICGLLTVALSVNQWMSILGVALTSFSCGLGEQTCLQYSSYYDKMVISTWSSGTGGAGIIGSFSYVVLNKLGLRNAILVMLVVPVLMGLTFWLLLLRPSSTKTNKLHRTHEEISLTSKLTFFRKIKKIPNLFKYMAPLATVYLFEYFINQGIFELINFEDIFINQQEQYRWLQVDYQIGVFISRSSVNLLEIKMIWLLSVLQLINVVIFACDAIFYVVPSFVIVLIMTLWEGLLGGAAYVNTFFKISAEVPEKDRKFSIGVTSFAETIGITFAGVFSILAHNAICELPKPRRLTMKRRF